jgi:hypothetical protein
VEYKRNFASKYSGYVRLDDTYHSRNRGPYQVPADSGNPSYNPGFAPNPAINQLNLRAGAIWEGWDASVYVLNALNNHPVLFDQEFSSGSQCCGLGEGFTIRPRTVGVTAKYKW